MTSISQIANFSGINASLTFTAGIGGLSLLRSSQSDGTISSRPRIDLRDAARQAQTRAQSATLLGRAAARLSDIRLGKFKAEQEYETRGAALQLAGQPIDIRIGKNGKILVEPLGATTNENITQRQRDLIDRSLTRIEELVSQDRLVLTRKNLRTTLNNLFLRLDTLRTGAVTRTTEEFDLQNLVLSGKPVSINFNSEGKLVVINQLENIDVVDDIIAQQVFFEAQPQIQALLDNQSTIFAKLIGNTTFDYTDSSGNAQSFTIEPWHGEIASFLSQVPPRAYTLSYNSITGQLSAEALTAKNQLPNFLKEKLDEPASPIAQFEKDALRFASEGKAYTLELRANTVRVIDLEQFQYQQIGTASNASNRALLQTRIGLLA